MLIRSVSRAIEARLLSPAGKRCGRSAFKLYRNGERRLRVVAQPLGAEQGSTAALLIGGREWARHPIDRSGFFHDVTTRRGESVPEPHAGDRIEIRANGALVASGVYQTH